ncbi:Holliday junction resolvase RuvX [Anaerorhabdus furcosa]|uniref:Putative pre-16S rRNA nuclease n=1 Tax=Anaerorhabdus furcosa TaxID=118967 RepID=A0A1T4PGT9_9FIRM|nr:Holliday junction resolvase RuvX [Anaerorhabdus furcosa]SJZ90722.1 putative holliday junction resolvase [Anaerorhabdus furcosa]
MKRVLGLDLGSVTCGVAVSDPLGIVARAVKTIRFPADQYENACDQVLECVKEFAPDEIVLGLPKHMNNDIGIRGQICIDFKEMLEEKCSCPIILVDERLSTVAAEKILIAADVSRKKRKKVIDQMAAVQILQGYLDRTY